MIKDLVKKLEKKGFKVDNHSGIMDGEPVYIIDLYGHPRQKHQFRVMAEDWYNFRGEVERIIEKFSKGKGKVEL